jgi:hypothetical protein
MTPGGTCGTAGQESHCGIMLAEQQKSPLATKTQMQKRKRAKSNFANLVPK